MKLLVTYRVYLPPECEGSTHELEVPNDTTAVSLLTQFGVPIEESVVLVNGRTPNSDELLQENDVVCAFPISAGGK
ncbi:MAG: hypothetical protein GY805_08350 [Chloroflexi bacterium]|nr:hypothetical protein [Chloroflexota bacterium]